MNKSYIFSLFLFAFCLSFSFPLQGSEASREAYLALIKSHPHLVSYPGEAKEGEIEILLDPLKMASIEKKMGREVGIVAKDKYWIWINDACKFPSGHEGIYGRILSLPSLGVVCAGVVVIPVLSDGTIALNCNFRHATRAWEAELPRGGVDLGEDIEKAAMRETLEETGLVVDSVSLLGVIPPDSGVTATLASVFIGSVSTKENAQREDFEAIESTLFLTPQEIKQAFVKGSLEVEIRGSKREIYFRDPFLAYALLLYELQLSSFLKEAIKPITR